MHALNYRDYRITFCSLSTGYYYCHNEDIADSSRAGWAQSIEGAKQAIDEFENYSTATL